MLVIDNNTAFLNVFAKLLEIKGFDVTAETTLKAGLKHVESKLYPIIFVDAPLDNYTANQILTVLTKSHVLKNSNVFLFSSVEFNDVELKQWRKEGLYSYLKKPVGRSTIMKALSDVRAKIHSTSQVQLNSQDEEATPEQMEKLNQLQKQIQELESLSISVPQTEPEDEEATPEQMEKLNQLQKQIQELESLSISVPQTEPEDEDEAVPQTEPEDEDEAVPQTEPEDEDEEATPEQMEKLNQLQKQIQELESVPDENPLSKNDLQSKKSVSVEPESPSDIRTFKNIINDLKSLQSKFESAEQSVNESSIQINTEQDNLVKKKLKETLNELSRLKNEIHSLEEIGDSDLKSNYDSLVNGKKSEINKKSTRTGTKKSEINKKSTRTGTKKSEINKKSTRTGTKKSSKLRKR